MDLQKLTNLETSCCFLVVLDDAQFADWHLRVTSTHPEAVVRAVRGKKCRTVAGLFDEFAAAWQFPYYFGENWNALDECLTDLEWLPGPMYLLLIRNAESLLHEAEPGDFASLMQLLQRAQDEWKTPNRYMPRQRLPTPFHVVLQCAPEDVAPFSLKLQEASTGWERLE